MSKTLKDKANHFMHHTASELTGPKGKHKYTEADIPNDVKSMVETLRHGGAFRNTGAGLRFGNNRKTFAKEKVFERRADRLKGKVTLRDLDEQ